MVRFNLCHGFKGFSPRLAGSTAETSWQNGVVEERCLVQGWETGTETPERKGPGTWWGTLGHACSAHADTCTIVFYSFTRWFLIQLSWYHNYSHSKEGQYMQAVLHTGLGKLCRSSQEPRILLKFLSKVGFLSQSLCSTDVRVHIQFSGDPWILRGSSKSEYLKTLRFIFLKSC